VVGSTGIEEGTMRQERIERKVVGRPRRPPEILPLDPRDADVVRAKVLRIHDRVWGAEVHQPEPPDRSV
jgi:hypothetical protein